MNQTSTRLLKMQYWKRNSIIQNGINAGYSYRSFLWNRLFQLYSFFIVLFLVLNGFKLSAQAQLKFSVSDQVIISSSHMPFWLWANQDGRIDPGASFLNLTDISADGAAFLMKDHQLRFDYGVTTTTGIEHENYLQVNRLFGGLDYKGWRINVGKYYDPKQLEGLSTTNGNLARSRNFRPYPRIGLSTDGFKSVPFARHWLGFRLEYDEGMLNDKRYVMHAHLHHKAFYFQVKPANDWAIQAGMEHFVMWGGTSRNTQIGDLPDDFISYLRYISGSPGSNDFPTTDQLNVAGNQYGTYQLKIIKDAEKYSLTFYLSHPFEDLSGVNWRNYPDNLLGVHFHLNNPDAFLSDFLYEFTDTRQQSISDSLYSWDATGQRWYRNLVDNYYSNSVYRSGVTYHQMAMCSPLIAPVLISNGMSLGFGSNRLVSHHIGLKGRILHELYWKTLLTATRYLGTYSQPYRPEKKQLSGLVEFNYINEKLPFDLRFSIAADAGSFYEDALGVQCSISKEW
ncbi:MAG TPA: capsule assembly Wzi family protein [Draconibacterium sp.]|nr:capsule assembly Wzi family protein [Draconibacterium sp.]